jgi:anti-anti-sigma regulatory factor
MMPPYENAGPGGATPPRSFVLPPDLDLTRADALHAALLPCIGQDAPLVIDGHAVDRISTACLQVLVAACVTARGRGQGFAMLAPSAKLGKAAQDLGLSAWLAPEPG